MLLFACLRICAKIISKNVMLNTQHRFAIFNVLQCHSNHFFVWSSKMNSNLVISFWMNIFFFAPLSAVYCRNILLTFNLRFIVINNFEYSLNKLIECGTLLTQCFKGSTNVLLKSPWFYPYILQDTPTIINGQSNSLIIKYATSANNTGSWRALFQFAESGKYFISLYFTFTFCLFYIIL